jgi:hypothetical protein
MIRGPVMRRNQDFPAGLAGLLSLAAAGLLSLLLVVDDLLSLLAGVAEAESFLAASLYFSLR